MKLSLKEAVLVSYYWAHDNGLTSTACETGLTKQTLVDWFSFHREAIELGFIMNKDKLGGPGLTVEINESMFGKRKHRGGRRIEGSWVIGALERETQRCFMAVVEKRNASTLLLIIQDRILPGTTIISDCWKSYKRLSDERFESLSVSHSVNLQDLETGFQAHLMKGSWVHAKKRLPLHGTKKGTLKGYLATHVWRREVGRKAQDPLEAFYKVLRMTFPLTE